RAAYFFGPQPPRLPGWCTHLARCSSCDWHWAQENQFLIQHARPFCRGISPEHKRGFANASIVAGMALGPAFGTLSGGILMSRLGWRPVFLVVGLTSLLWLLPWLRWMPKANRDSTSHPKLSSPPCCRF